MLLTRRRIAIFGIVLSSLLYLVLLIALVRPSSATGAMVDLMITGGGLWFTAASLYTQLKRPNFLAVIRQQKTPAWIQIAIILDVLAIVVLMIATNAGAGPPDR